MFSSFMNIGLIVVLIYLLPDKLILQNCLGVTCACRSLTSLSVGEETARAELCACSAEQCGSLQAAATDLQRTVTNTGDGVETFSTHVTNFCDEMQQVCPV